MLLSLYLFLDRLLIHEYKFLMLVWQIININGNFSHLQTLRRQSHSVIIKECSTNSPQYKNANIANFVLDVPLEMNKTSEDYSLETPSICTYWYLM